MLMMERSTSARSPFSGPLDRSHSHSHHQGEAKSEPMDITITNVSTGSPELENQEGGAAPSDSAAPGVSGSLAISSTSNGLQQPKVQTAFIHKLYNMLEDAAIQHLISWSSSGESFVMSPTGEFSRVLSQYFKHTNVSSFVRQLNMYGFHKVNDVFHSTSPDAALWEFKHGNGSFKRGDLVGLREIKRRASRHTLTHKESYPGLRSTAPSAPGTPNEPPPDTMENRLVSLEQAFWDVNSRVHRLEDVNNSLGNQCQNLLEGLTRCHQWTIDLSQYIARLVPQSDTTILREIQSRQKEIERYATSLEESIEVFQRERVPAYSFPPLDNGPPISPRHGPIDEDGRRPPPALRPGIGGYFRPPFNSVHNNSLPQRRFGSMSGASALTPNSSSSLHPSSLDRLGPRSSSHQAQPNNLSRRHTSADIRLQGWNPSASSPFSHPNSVQWGNSTSSRSGQPQNAQDDVPPSFSNYEIRPQPLTNPRFSFSSARKSPPPFEPSLQSIGADTSWSFATAKQATSSPSKFDPPPPPMGSRRGSIVSSNVHALLNPSSGQEPSGHTDSDKGSDTEQFAEESRKRKRLD